HTRCLSDWSSDVCSSDLALGGAEHPLFYLETPPSLFGTVVHGLAKAELTEGARVVIEKPFGHDLVSARELNRELLSVLGEEQIRSEERRVGKGGTPGARP